MLEGRVEEVKAALQVAKDGYFVDYEFEVGRAEVLQIDNRQNLGGFNLFNFLLYFLGP